MSSLPSKYPSTPHLPFSPGLGDDDTVATSLYCRQALFTNSSSGTIDTVITEKLDGGNCCLHQGQVFARTTKKPTSLPWFSNVKQQYRLWQMQYHIPDSYCIYGENMSAVHSIEYDNATSHFYIFGILDLKPNDDAENAQARWLSWDETVAFATMLNVQTVPELTRQRFASLQDLQKWMENRIQQTSRLGNHESCTPEGFVIRRLDSFSHHDFDRCVFKYVRAEHVQTEPDFKRKWKKAIINISNEPDETIPQRRHEDVDNETILPIEAPAKPQKSFDLGLAPLVFLVGKNSLANGVRRDNI